MRSFRIGIDSYSLNPLRLPPHAVLDWVGEHGGDGVQFTELHLGRQTADDGFLRELAAHVARLGLYIEWGGGQHIPFDTTTWQPRDLLALNTRAAREARAVGATIIRSCSGGLMRWSDEAPPTDALLREMARALRAQRSMLVDQGVVLAIELHFEFTTFELLRVFEMCDAAPGEWLGVCLDTMNLLTMLEDPVAGTERILPWVVATHAKDGCLRFGDTGLVSFPTAMGCGDVDFAAILARLTSLERTVHLSVEAHGGSFEIPIFDPTFLARFPDLTATELARLIALARRGEQRIGAGEVAPVERADWPRLAEQRVSQDIESLRQIVARAPATTARTAQERRGGVR
jgi:sugar phosphate isomerase/epimerase